MNLVVPTYQGRDMATLMTSLREVLLRSASPVTLDDAATEIGLTDPYVRRTVLRAFRASLNEGGPNFDLTRQGKWAVARGRSPEGIERGKSLKSFQPTTRPTDTLKAQVAKLNGELSSVAQEAALQIASNLAATAGKNVREAAIGVVAEDLSALLNDNAALGRELAVHRKYQEASAAKDAMIVRLVDEITGRNGGGTSAVRK